MKCILVTELTALNESYSRGVPKFRPTYLPPSLSTKFCFHALGTLNSATEDSILNNVY